MEILDSFHFARPWALLLIPITLLLVIWYLRFRHVSNPWQQQMRPDLQQQLLAAPEQQPGYLLWMILAITLTGTAVSGPSWSQQSRPVLSKQDNLVVVMDLSLSMLATDIQPNRITRSKQKLQDLLQQRQEGMTALVVYSGQAHTVTPLTQDTATISNLLPALEPLMMPALGSAAENGIEQAKALIRQSGFQKGRILLMTDGLDSKAQDAIRRQLSDEIPLSIMLVGTKSGAPMPLDNQGFVKDQQGNVIISQADLRGMQNFADEHQIRLHQMTLNHDDLTYLLPPTTDTESFKETQQARVPLWIEQGHWFLLPVLPLAALAFRRNGLLLLPLLAPLMLPIMLILAPQPAYAFWKTPQQQGETAFRQGDYQQAEQLLEDPLWRGSTYYRQGDYQAAVEAFAQYDTAQAHYNRGNALARLGRLDEAISAYSQALEKAPDLKDAEHNRRLVEQLRQQQEKAQNPEQNPEQKEDASEDDRAPSQNTSQTQSDPEQEPSRSTASPSSGSSQPQPSSPRQTPSSQLQPGSPGDSGASENRDTAGNNLPDPDRATPQTPSPGEQTDTSDESGMARQDSESPGTPQNTTAEQNTDNQQGAMSEEELSLEQWLRRIPDDPSGLMRRKFEYEARKNREPLPEGRAPW